jgi:2-polyprenyl-3-methyl-5-hydroxy-6-metoxy-1,4-benzoquinol methylase
VSAPDPTPGDYSDRYDPDEHVDRWYTDATADAVLRWIRPGDAVLELGCATGRMTERFASRAAHVTAVDRSEPYLDRARRRAAAGVAWRHADITTFECDRTFDHVVATNVVHELDDPIAFLARCRRWAGPHGHVHVSHQNPHSIHRLAGIDAGLAGSVHEVTDEARSLQTVRLYARAELEELGERAGLRCVHHEGVMLKPVPNSSMATLPDDVLRSLVAVAHRFPEHCSMNYLVYTRA